MAAEDLKVHFPIQRGLLKRTVGHIKAVDGISLAVRAGQTVGVVGESGSGKTTLGLAMLRLLPSQGGIDFAGQPLQGLSWRELRPLRREMQIVFQDPFGSLSPRLSVGQIVAEGLELHRIGDGAAGRRAMVSAMLRRWGSTRPTRTATRTSSPAASASGSRSPAPWSCGPRLVVLDEPTSALDMSVQAQIVDLLRDLQRRHGLAYLFISHDLRVVRAMSHEVVVMKDGIVVERGPTEAHLHGAAAGLHQGADGGRVPDRGGAGGGSGGVASPVEHVTVRAWRLERPQGTGSGRAPALLGGQDPALVPIEPGRGFACAGCVLHRAYCRLGRGCLGFGRARRQIRSCDLLRRPETSGSDVPSCSGLGYASGRLRSTRRACSARPMSLSIRAP